MVSVPYRELVTTVSTAQGERIRPYTWPSSSGYESGYVQPVGDIHELLEARQIASAVGRDQRAIQPNIVDGVDGDTFYLP